MQDIHCKCRRNAYRLNKGVHAAMKVRNNQLNVITGVNFEIAITRVSACTVLVRFKLPQPVGYGSLETEGRILELNRSVTAWCSAIPEICHRVIPDLNRL